MHFMHKIRLRNATKWYYRIDLFRICGWSEHPTNIKSKTPKIIGCSYKFEWFTLDVKYSTLCRIGDWRLYKMCALCTMYSVQPFTVQCIVIKAFYKESSLFWHFNNGWDTAGAKGPFQSYRERRIKRRKKPSKN